MPSIFHSAAAGDSRSNADATLGADAASIGRSGRPTCKPTERSAAEAADGPWACQRGLGHSSEGPAKQIRSADLLGGHFGCTSHRLEHQAVKRALAQVTSEQADQERAFAWRGPLEERRQEPAAVSLRAMPRRRADGCECRIGLGQGQGRPGRPASACWASACWAAASWAGLRAAAVGRSGLASCPVSAQQVAEGRVPDPDLALAQFAGEECHHYRDFGGASAAEQGSDLGHFGAASRRRSDRI